MTPEHPGPVCTQQTVTFDPAAGATYAQASPFHSPEWERLYGSPRNTIESFNGALKNDDRRAHEPAPSSLGHEKRPHFGRGTPITPVETGLIGAIG